MKRDLDPFEVRGHINDLNHTLTAALVNLDDLLLILDESPEEYSLSALANDQLERALEFFLKMRSEFLLSEKMVIRGPSRRGSPCHAPNLPKIAPLIKVRF